MQNYQQFFLITLLLCFLVDVFASLFLSGRCGPIAQDRFDCIYRPYRECRDVAEPTWAEAEIDKALLDDVVFLHILTGDGIIDRRAKKDLLDYPVF